MHLQVRGASVVKLESHVWLRPANRPIILIGWTGDLSCTFCNEQL